MLEVQNVSMARRTVARTKAQAEARHREAEVVVPRLKSDRPPHFIKQWRNYRGLTQEALAERVDMTPNNLSQLENFKQGYSNEGLEKLADALNCEPGQLLMVDPSKDDAIWSIWEQAKPGQRQQIIGFAKGLVAKTGS